MAEPWRLQRRDLCIPLGGGARGKLQGWLSRIVDRGLAQKTRAVDRITEPLSSKNKMADRRVLEIMPSGAELEVRIHSAPAQSRAKWVCKPGRMLIDLLLDRRINGG